MNPLNYASLSASKRLVDAGVVLKTEVYWSYEPTNIITPRCNQSSEIIIERRWVLTMFPPMGSACYPAASMAEAWRELPYSYKTNKRVYTPTLEKDGLDGATIASLVDGEDTLIWFRDFNPVDAIVQLRVWITEAEGEKQ